MISSWILGRSEDLSSQGYGQLMMYFCMLATLGILLNTWLYIDDIWNRNGILNAIDQSGASSDVQKPDKLADQKANGRSKK